MYDLDTSVIEGREGLCCYILLDTSIYENREGMDTSIYENREGMDTSINENREGMDTSINENREGMCLIYITWIPRSLRIERDCVATSYGYLGH